MRTYNTNSIIKAGDLELAYLQKLDHQQNYVYLVIKLFQNIGKVQTNFLYPNITINPLYHLINIKKCIRLSRIVHTHI